MFGSIEPALGGGVPIDGVWFGSKEGRLMSLGDVGFGPNGSSVELGPVDPPGTDGGAGMVGIASVGAVGRSTSRVLLSRLLHGPHTNM